MKPSEKAHVIVFGSGDKFRAFSLGEMVELNITEGSMPDQNSITLRVLPSEARRVADILKDMADDAEAGVDYVVRAGAVRRLEKP